MATIVASIITGCVTCYATRNKSQTDTPAATATSAATATATPSASTTASQGQTQSQNLTINPAPPITSGMGRASSAEQSGGVTIGSINGATQINQNSKNPVQNNESGSRGAPQMFNNNSPGAKQVVNQRRLIKKNVDAQWGHRPDGTQILRLVFHQTSGIWDAGTKFWLQADFDGPYSHVDVKGFPQALYEASGPVKPEAIAQGLYEFFTTTAPFTDGDIVFEFESSVPLAIKQLRLVLKEAD